MENKKKFTILIVVLAILAAAAFLFEKNYKKYYQKPLQVKKELKPGMLVPEKLQAIPDFYNSWPIEREKIIYNVSLNQPQPIDTDYTLTYESAKSVSDILNSYQKTFQDKNLVFRQQDSSSKGKFLQTLSTNLEKENATLSVRVEVRDKTYVTLQYIKYLPDNKIQSLPAVAPTFRQDVPNLALSKNFPASFPLPAGAKIVESYNMINSENGAAKEAVIVLNSSKSADEIKTFYAGQLKPPAFKAVANANGLVFTNSLGILNIAIIAHAGSTEIKISQDILVPIPAK